MGKSPKEKRSQEHRVKRLKGGRGIVKNRIGRLAGGGRTFLRSKKSGSRKI